MPTPRTERFLPHVGSLSTALRILFIAAVIAVVLAIARNPVVDGRAWEDFTFLVLVALSVGVTAVIVLMPISGLVRRLSAITGSIIVFLVLLGATALAVEAVIYGLHYIGLLAERSPAWRSSFMVRSLLISGILSLFVLRYLFLTHRAEHDAKLEQEARMQALQSRIRPHFLFNSMNSIASLTRSDPARAEAALQDLADLFRVLLADARKLVPISAEREISRQYLEIEKLRLGDRLKVSWHVSNIPRNALVPALTLQPLLENAIYHGIEPRFGGGTVKIELWTEGDTLNFMISNPLPDVPKHAHGKGNKIAMENIRQRLASHFGRKTSLQSFKDDSQYHVKVKMPIMKG